MHANYRLYNDFIATTTVVLAAQLKLKTTDEYLSFQDFEIKFLMVGNGKFTMILLRYILLTVYM